LPHEKCRVSLNLLPHGNLTWRARSINKPSVTAAIASRRGVFTKLIQGDVMKDASLHSSLSAFYLFILAVTTFCFFLIGFKPDAILFFELIVCIAGLALSATMWLKVIKNPKYR
jgi:hypothetical protein